MGSRVLTSAMQGFCSNQLCELSCTEQVTLPSRLRYDVQQQGSFKVLKFSEDLIQGVRLVLFISCWLVYELPLFSQFQQK